MLYDKFYFVWNKKFKLTGDVLYEKYKYSMETIDNYFVVLPN